MHGRSISLPRLASWRFGCTRRVVDRFEMSQLQSSVRSQHNFPQRALNKECVGNGSARGNFGLFDMLVSAARPPSFVPAQIDVNILDPGALFPSFCGRLFRPSRPSILWAPLVLGWPLGVHPLSVSPCLQAACHESLHRLRPLQNPVFDNFGRRGRRKATGMTAHVPCFQRTSSKP